MLRIRPFVLLWIRPHNFLFARIRPLVMVSPFVLLWIRPHNFLFERIRPLVMDSSTRILFLRGFVLLLWIRPFLVCGFVHFYVPFWFGI